MQAGKRYWIMLGIATEADTGGNNVMLQYQETTSNALHAGSVQASGWSDAHGGASVRGAAASGVPAASTSAEAKEAFTTPLLAEPH